MPDRPSSATTPEIIAHRGASRQRRENTLAAFERAFALGADAIELDVHATADGVVVVHHDPVLGADAGALAGRAIASLRAAEVQGGDAAAETRIPSLDEVLSLVNGRATVYVEIKGAGIESRVVDAIARSPGRGARCAVHSFDHRAARRARELSGGVVAGEIPAGILLVSRPIDPVAVMRAAGARDLWQHWELLDADLVAAVHGADGRVVAWTVNDPTVARAFATMGVDGICTDVPDLMRAALAR
jgi:glycerophosphoryl diester phosphodiesterase